jgi:hypothetical protein
MCLTVIARISRAGGAKRLRQQVIETHLADLAENRQAERRISVTGARLWPVCAK